MTLLDIIDDGSNIHELVDLSIRTEQLHDFMNKALEDREFQIIAMRYGLYKNCPQTQSEIGDSLGISRSYVSRLESKAIGKLRNMYNVTLDEDN